MTEPPTLANTSPRLSTALMGGFVNWPLETINDPPADLSGRCHLGALAAFLNDR